jgi:branched-chain amino acid transport system permease protein
MESILVLSIVVIGGMGSIPGVLVGAVIIQGVPELVRWLADTGIMSSSAAETVPLYRNLVLAVIMIAMMAFRPTGIIPSKRMSRELAAKQDVGTLGTVGSPGPAGAPESPDKLGGES